MKFTRRRPLAALAATTVLVASTGCAAWEEADERDEKLSVAAGFYPLAWVAEQVVGEHGDVVNLTRPGQEAHDSELSLASTAKMAEADVVLLNSGFQPAVDETVAENAEGEVFDVADWIELRSSSDHHEGHDHGEADEDDHDHGDTDPHFWLDPTLMAHVADNIAKRLGEVDVSHAPDFDENAQALREKLTALDTAYSEGLKGCAVDTVVVSHDAFGYLGRYGLHFEPIAGLTPGAEPTPADLARLQDLIRTEKLTTVFTETLAPPALAGQLAKDMGVETAVLDPIEGLVDSTADEDYLTLMERNLETLKKANQC